METRESELRSRLEDEYEGKFPKPKCPWYKNAVNKTKEDLKNLEAFTFEEETTQYFSNLLKNMIDFEAVYMISYPEDYEEYNDKLEQWRLNRDNWVEERMS